MRRGSKGSDPLLNTREWRVTIRSHWLAVKGPCAQCGRDHIQYGAPRYLPGTRRVNPNSLVVGHIVGRDQAKRLGWSEAQINALSNTAPEAARCSDRSGAVYGNRKRGRGKRVASNVLVTTRAW